MYRLLLELSDWLVEELRKHSPNFPLVKYSTISKLLDNLQKNNFDIPEYMRSDAEFIIANLLELMVPRYDEQSQSTSATQQQEMDVRVKELNGELYISNIMEALNVLFIHLKNTVSDADEQVQEHKRNKYLCCLYISNILSLRILFAHEQKPHHLAWYFIGRSPQKLTGLMLLLKERKIPFQSIVQAGLMDVFYEANKLVKPDDSLKHLTDQNIIPIEKTYGKEFNDYIDALEKQTVMPIQPRIRITPTSENIVMLRRFSAHLFRGLLQQCGYGDQLVAEQNRSHFKVILNLLGGCKNIPPRDSMFILVKDEPRFLPILLEAIDKKRDQLIPFLSYKDGQGLTYYQQFLAYPDQQRAIMFSQFLDYSTPAVTELLIKTKDSLGNTTLFFMMLEPVILDKFLSMYPTFSIAHFLEKNDANDPRHLDSLRTVCKNKDILIILLLHYLQFNKAFPFLKMMEDSAFANFIHANSAFHDMLKTLLPDTTVAKIFKDERESMPQMDHQNHYINTFFGSSADVPFDVPLTTVDFNVSRLIQT